ncbi:hypothetical protein MVES_001750 [Malassezia vespertilionis]|uniref:HD domain-containing protein n=1 Tax=Malassezia vespertilionis TaxID=2020962 RepID=A0A2N1JDH8_9BASI|nr:hypothetical protein MVES_001750 [Malassezia vespertilionis]
MASSTYSSVLGLMAHDNGLPSAGDTPHSTAKRVLQLHSYKLDPIPSSLLGDPSAEAALLDGIAVRRLNEERAVLDREIAQIVKQKQAYLDTMVHTTKTQLASLRDALHAKQKSHTTPMHTHVSAPTHNEAAPLHSALSATFVRYGSHCPPAEVSPQRQVEAPQSKRAETQPSPEANFHVQESDESDTEAQSTEDTMFEIDEELKLDASHPHTPMEQQIVEKALCTPLHRNGEAARQLNMGIATSFSGVHDAAANPLLRKALGAEHDTLFDAVKQGPYDLQHPNEFVGSLHASSRSAIRHDSHSTAERKPAPYSIQGDDEHLVRALAANIPSHRHRTFEAGGLKPPGQSMGKWSQWQHRVRDQETGTAVSAMHAFAASVPAHTFTPMRRPAQETRDTAEFDCEPKTSLPDKEKMLVPSLRRAIRTAKMETQTSSPRGPVAKNDANDTELPPLPFVPSADVRLSPNARNAPRAIEPVLGWEAAAPSNAVHLLHYMHYLQNLKVSKRTGWYHHNVPSPESIADHMYRMAMLAMLLGETNIDTHKCVMMALVHDLAEAQVGDLTPLCNIPKVQKQAREHDAIIHLTEDLLHNTPAAQHILALWTEYEERKTPEAQLRSIHGIRDLQPFWLGGATKIHNPHVRGWLTALLQKRRALWERRGEPYDAGAAPL